MGLDLQIMDMAGETPEEGGYTNAIGKENMLFTIEDIYNLPDGKRAELIDGQMYMMFHQIQNIRL